MLTGLGYRVTPLALAVCAAVYFALPRVMAAGTCGALVRAEDGQDPAALRDRTFEAFRDACRTTCFFSTEPTRPVNFRFILKPLSSLVKFRINFKVKAAGDVLLSLASTRTEQSGFAFIVIGIGSPERNAGIGECHDKCPSLHFQDSHIEAGLVSGDEYRPFWIEWIEGVVTVGKGGQSEGFLTAHVTTHLPSAPEFVHLGISTWTTNHGDWLFYQFCG